MTVKRRVGKGALRAVPTVFAHVAVLRHRVIGSVSNLLDR
jgi:hypothetical protein